MAITSGDPVGGDPSTKSPCPIESGYGIFCLRSFASKTGGLPPVIRLGEDPSTKSPCPIASGYGIFCLRSFASKTGFGSQTKNPSFASLRGDLVEVGGGFEPPFPVLQTDS